MEESLRPLREAEATRLRSRPACSDAKLRRLAHFLAAKSLDLLIRASLRCFPAFVDLFQLSISRLPCHVLVHEHRFGTVYRREAVS